MRSVLQLSPKIAFSIYLLCFWVGGMTGAERNEPPPQLVAYTSAHAWREFVVEKEAIAARSSGETKFTALSSGVFWRLEGDLSQHPELCYYSPIYHIEEIPPGVSCAAPRIFATVTTPADQWTPAQIKGSIVVLAWLVGGQVARVSAVAAHPSETAPFLAVQAMELDPLLATGQPVVLLYSRSGFVAPKPWSKNPKLQRLVEAMHFFPSDVEKIIPDLVSVNEVGHSGATLLHVAAEGGFASAVQHLLRAGARIDAKSDSSARPIDWAATNGRRDMVKFLAIAGKNIDRNVVGYAFGGRHLDLIADLTELSPALAGKQLASLAVLFGRQDKLSLAMSLHPRDTLSEIRPSFIERAIRYHDLAILELLLNNGVKGTAEALDTPLLVVAADAKKTEAVAALLRAGAKVGASDPDGNTALIIAAQRGSIEIVEALLSAKANPRARNREGLTALHRAAAGGHAQIAAALLSHGARWDANDDKGRTPLDLALGVRAAETVAILVRAGATLDPTQKTFGANFVHALALDQIELVKRVAEKNPRISQSTLQSYRAADIAALYKAAQCLEALRGYDREESTAGLAFETSVDRPPRLIAGIRPNDPRRGDFSSPALTVKISGLIDETGRLLFPSVMGTDNALVVGAILEAMSTWRFEPASKASRAVKFMIQLPIDFPSQGDHIYTVDELDTPPLEIDRPRIGRGTSIVTEVDMERNARIVRPPGGTEAYLEETARAVPRQMLEVVRGEYAVLSCVVEKDGRARYPTVINGSSTQFQVSAIEALSRFRFKPGIRGGAPVRARITLVIQPN